MIKDRTPFSILVIEDNPGDQVIVEEYLHEHLLGPKITGAASYQEAKTILESKEDAFDVILLDLTLPDISKEALIEATGQINLEIPVIILTGYTDLDFAVRSLSVGVSDYLLKDTITPLVIYKSILYSIERQRFLKSLRASEKKYMDIFHLSPEPMWVYEAATLKFLDVNKAAIERYGYSKDEFLSMTLAEIRPAEDMPLLDQAIRDIEQISGGGVVKGGPYRHRKKDSSVIFVDLRFNSIDFKGSKAMIILATDVTERVARLRAIEEQNRNLKEIAWTQSHIVRAPVARLKSIVDMLTCSVELDDFEREKLLKSIRDSADELDIITKDIARKSQIVLDNDSPLEGMQDVGGYSDDLKAE